MDNSPLQLAKRELHSFFAARPVWMGTVAAGVLLGLAGPFGTDEVMRLIPRILYWAAIAVLTFLTGSIVDAILRAPFSAWVGQWAAIPGVSLVTAALITGEIVGLNALIFGFVPNVTGFWILFGNVFSASLVISGTLAFVSQPASPDTPEPTVANAPALLSRLPLDKRGALMSLSAVDHYVEVTTTKGTDLLLMRLSDAIAETHPVSGLQIHRSHWVAVDHVTKVNRQSGKATLTLKDGRALPVSRSNLPRLKDAGLIPT